MRDTKSVPCWLAEYEGETVLPHLADRRERAGESAVARSPGAGGGRGVRRAETSAAAACSSRCTLSVMPELDGACNTILPAEDRYNLTFEPPRPPGPSRGRLAFGDPAPAGGATPVRRPTAVRSFTLQYEFDGMVAFRHAQIAAADSRCRARRAQHAKLRITGYRSASRLSNGTVMREREEHRPRARRADSRAASRARGSKASHTRCSGRICRNARTAAADAANRACGGRDRRR